MPELPYRFTRLTHVVIPGTVHQCGLLALDAIRVEDSAIPGSDITRQAVITVNATTYDIHVTFAQPKNGIVYLRQGVV